MGQALTIPLSTLSKGQQAVVNIKYATTGECTALQWLDKQCVQLVSYLPCTDIQ